MGRTGEVIQLSDSDEIGLLENIELESGKLIGAGGHWIDAQRQNGADNSESRRCTRAYAYGVGVPLVPPVKFQRPFNV